MSPEARQKLMLVLLAVVLAWAGFRYLGGWLRSTAAGQALGLQRPKQVDVQALLGTQIAELRTDGLERRPGEFTPGRNPWRYGPAEKPQQAAPKAAPRPLPSRTAAPEPVQQTAPAKPQPPAIDLVLLGTFGPMRRKIAVFSDEESVLNALVGDVLKDKFQVQQIGLESVDLTFVGFPDEPPARLAIGG